MAEFVEGAVELLQKLGASPCTLTMLILALAAFCLVDRASKRMSESEAKRLDQINRMLEITQRK